MNDKETDSKATNGRMPRLVRYFIMKYITTKTLKGKKEIFVFSRDINHNDMAESIARIRDTSGAEWKRVTRTPVSAGFVSNMECYGESESLSLQSDPADTGLLHHS